MSRILSLRLIHAMHALTSTYKNEKVIRGEIFRTKKLFFNFGDLWRLNR